MKREKGEYGYLAQFKKMRLILTLLLFAAMACIIGFGYFRYHSMKTIFTVVGLLFSLPIAKVLSGLLVVLPLKPIPEEEKREMEQKMNHIPKEQILWDLALSSEEKVRHFPCVVYSDKTVIALYRDNKKASDVEEAKKYFRNLLKNNCHKTGFLLLTKEDKFLEKIAATNFESEDEKEIKRIKETILVYEM